MSEAQVCPWCQMEIVWDSETGPEAECPHCYNELKDYRTLTLDVDIEEDEEPAPIGDLYDYEQRVQAYLDHQEPELTLECEQCQESMIAAGEWGVDPSQFKPKQLRGLQPFMLPPFELQVHVCPSCFQCKTTLSEAGRMQIMRNLQKK